VTLLTPVVPPPIRDLFQDYTVDQQAPVERRLTRRLVEAVGAASRVSERAAAGEDNLFGDALTSGVSANLCQALARIIEPFAALDVSVTWARTWPVPTPSPVVRFGHTDAVVLREAGRALRAHAPMPDVRLHGFVRLLKRGEVEDDGKIHLATEIDGQQ